MKRLIETSIHGVILAIMATVSVTLYLLAALQPTETGLTFTPIPLTINYTLVFVWVTMHLVAELSWILTWISVSFGSCKREDLSSENGNVTVVGQTVVPPRYPWSKSLVLLSVVQEVVTPDGRHATHTKVQSYAGEHLPQDWKFSSIRNA